MLILPLLIGYFIKRNYDDALQSLSSALKVDLRLMRFHQGWFHANCVLAANFPLIDKPLNTGLAGTESLIIKQRINYGPFLLTLKPSDYFKVALASIDSYFDANHHFAETLLAFNGDLKSHLHLESFGIKQHNKLVYGFKNLNGDIISNGHEKRFFADLQCEHLYSALNQMREIDDFSAKYNLVNTAEGIWVGSHFNHFGKLVWQQDDSIYSFQEFNHDLKSTVVRNRYAVVIREMIRNTSVQDQQYGPQQLQITMNDIDQKEMKNLQEAFASLEKEVVTPQHITHLKNIIISLLSKGATLHLDQLLLNTAWGEVVAQAKWNSLANPCVKNFLQLVDNANIALKAQVPVPLATQLLRDIYRLRSNAQGEDSVKQVEETLQSWQKTGWLLNTGKDFLIDLQWRPARTLDACQQPQ